jgi:hypothetical protein
MGMYALEAEGLLWKKGFEGVDDPLQPTGALFNY